MSATENPLVSVIVPTYKRADKIARAIASILNQTYVNFEIVIVDDNGPESPYRAKTRRALDAMNASDKICIVETVGSTGGGAARNFAVNHANGEYLAFLDDDDEFKVDKLEKQLCFMLENGLEMSYQDVEWFTEDGKLVERRTLNHAEAYDRASLLRAHLLTPISPTSIYMIKKSLFDRTDGFGEVKTGQDWFLMLRCIEAGGKIMYMPGAYVKQYLHDGERLSTGQNKIDGEVMRHEIVKGYYPQLSKKDIKFIEFRHNAVLAFSCARSHNIAGAVKYAVRAFVASPVDSLLEGIEFFSRGKRA